MQTLRAPRISPPGAPKLARALEQWRRLIDRANNLGAEAPLTVEKTDAGDIVSLSLPLSRKVKLTGAGGTAGSYDAAEAHETAGGGWSLTTSGWTGTVWEFNLNAGIDLSGGVFVTAEYHAPSDDWRFQLGSCPP